jgi:hypothetical protein
MDDNDQGVSEIMRRFRWFGGLAAALMFCWPASALATGGGSIASAPTVAYGQQEFGNTATDLPANEFAQGYCYSWWLVPAITGDKITIDWTSEPDASGAYLTALWAYLYPIGTTDFNFANTTPAAEKDVNYAVTGLQELQYITTSDGTFPLQFQASASDCQADAGPYSFTAYITHELVLGLHAHTNRARHSTTFSVAVHNPDGAAITGVPLVATYQLLSHGHWEKMRSGALQLTKRWGPARRGTFQSVRVTVSGPSYRSASESIRIKAV